MKWIATLIVTTAVVGLSLAASPCPDGFENLSDNPVVPKCLSFATTTGSWHSMLSMCKMLDATLAKITGDAHNQVYKYIIDRPNIMDKCFWIGGSDQEMEAHWKWESDGSEIPLGGPHWDPCNKDEPNGGTNENYLAICPNRYYFKDYEGDKMFHAICEYVI